MNGYAPHDPAALAAIAAVGVATLLAGLALNRMPLRRRNRWLAWLLTAAATAGVTLLGRSEPAGLRMIAIIGALVFGMKAVVSVESRTGGAPPLSLWRWLGFAALWPGMRPAPFARAGRRPQPGAWRLIGHGCLLGAVGLALVGLAWLVWHHARPLLPTTAARVVATVLLLPGLSLALHFGIFNVLAGLWRLAGVDARPLFRAPLAARSLGEFWGRRWNLAFSEMIALGVYRPLSARLGRRPATLTAFLASGVLHELAISLPVMAGFGLPMSYFLLHGIPVLAERRMERQGRPVNARRVWSRVRVIAWLSLPAPILFHPWFLRGVIWPIVGMP